MWGELAGSCSAVPANALNRSSQHSLLIDLLVDLPLPYSYSELARSFLKPPLDSFILHSPFDMLEEFYDVQKDHGERGRRGKSLMQHPQDQKHKDKASWRDNNVSSRSRYAVFSSLGARLELVQFPTSTSGIKGIRHVRGADDPPLPRVTELRHSINCAVNSQDASCVPIPTTSSQSDHSKARQAYFSQVLPTLPARAYASKNPMAKLGAYTSKDAYNGCM